MHRLPLTRNLSEDCPANERGVQKGFPSDFRTCFFALVFIIAPALGLAAAALGDVVFPHVDVPHSKAPRLSLVELQDAFRSQASQAPISEAVRRSQD